MSYPIGNNNTASRTEGAGRYDSADPDEGTVDIEPHLENALDLVIECILRHGAYPQPRKVGMFFTSGSNAPRRFDLSEWIVEHIDEADVYETFVLMLTQSAYEFGYSKAKWEKRVEQMLVAELTGSSIVSDKAEDLANEERRERRG